MDTLLYRSHVFGAHVGALVEAVLAASIAAIALVVGCATRIMSLRVRSEPLPFVVDYDELGQRRLRLGATARRALPDSKRVHEP